MSQKPEIYCAKHPKGQSKVCAEIQEKTMEVSVHQGEEMLVRDGTKCIPYCKKQAHQTEIFDPATEVVKPYP